MADRDSKGRFIPGNRVGPGRPRKTREEKYYQAAVSSVSVEDWKQIVKRTVLDARRGNAAARTWLTNLLLGSLAPPDNSVNITLPDVITQALDKIYGQENG